MLDWDDQVSRLHARFERVEEDWTLVDDGLSRNGTFVNGERLSGRRRLIDGDTLRFGATTMTFRSPRAEQQAGHGGRRRQPGRRGALDHAAPRAGGAVPSVQGRQRRSPARPTDEQIAEELFLSVDAVKTHLRVLFAKFGIEQLPQNEKRVRLVERAFYGGADLRARPLARARSRLHHRRLRGRERRRLGGIGILYRARQVRLDRPVALKLVEPEVARDPVIRERLRREARTLAALDHPNVVPLYEAGEEDGTVYIVTRWVEGTELGTLIRARRPARARAGGADSPRRSPRRSRWPTRRGSSTGTSSPPT